MTNGRDFPRLCGGWLAHVLVDAWRSSHPENRELPTHCLTLLAG